VPPEVPPRRAQATRARRFTWRVAAFVGALVLLALVAFGGALWYGRNTYYVIIDQDQVSIFKGRQGGFLWLDPTVEARFPVSAAQVPPAESGKVAAGVVFASREEAETYVRNLAEEAAELGLIETERPTTTTTSTTTTTTTTTTTVPPTTVPTTAPAAPTTVPASTQGSATP
jgi:protein phosphatase